MKKSSRKKTNKKTVSPAVKKKTKKKTPKRKVSKKSNIKSSLKKKSAKKSELSEADLSKRNKDCLKLAEAMLCEHFDAFEPIFETYSSDTGLGWELAGLRGRGSHPVDLILEYSEKRECLFSLDWTGEDGPEFDEFLSDRLLALDGSEMDWEPFEKMYKKIDWKKLKRGEYILKKFKVVDKTLRKKGLVLACYFDGSDRYQIFITEKKLFSKVSRLRFFREHSNEPEYVHAWQ